MIHQKTGIGTPLYFDAFLVKQENCSFQLIIEKISKMR